jgi:hypothetical protein
LFLRKDEFEYIIWTSDEEEMDHDVTDQSEDTANTTEDTANPTKDTFNGTTIQQLRDSVRLAKQ